MSITGREPRLSSRMTTGYQRLSVRRLGSLLKVLRPDSVSPDVAAAMLESDDFYVRYNAACLLGERADREARLILQKALNNPRVPVRASAARQLFHFSWFSGQPLIEQALTDSDERVREAAVYALCDLREAQAYRRLTEVLQHESDTVRAAAAWGLRDCQDTAAVPVLAAVLQAADPEIRGKALGSLSANNTAEALPVVLSALEDDDSEVIYQAVLTWLELSGEKCISDLVEKIRHADSQKREPMLRAFFHGSNYQHFKLAAHPQFETVMEALAICMDDSQPAVRMAAVWLLASLHHEQGTRILHDSFYRETNAEVKEHIVRVATNLMVITPDDEMVQEAAQSDDLVLRELAERYRRAPESATAYDPDDVAANPLTRAELAGRPSRQPKK